MVADAGLNNTGQRGDGWEMAGQEQVGAGRSGLDRTGRASVPRNPGAPSAAGCDKDSAFPNDRTAPEMPDPRKLAQDWITLWQSELSAMAADPEIRETWQALTNLWAGTMSAMLQGLPHAPVPGSAWHDRAGGQTGPADAPRPAPAAAAPDPRDAEVERLARHVAVLERRLANLEHGGLEHKGDPGVAAKRRPKRVPKRK